MTKVEREATRVLRNQQRKGRAHYKRGISHRRHSGAFFIDSAIEEAVDLVQYLIALKFRMQGDRI